MTTPIAQSITDELLAEIQADFDPSGSRSEKMEAGGLWGDHVHQIIARLRAAEAMLKFVLDNQITIWEQNGTSAGNVYSARRADGSGCREWYKTREQAIQAAMGRQP